MKTTHCIGIALLSAALLVDPASAEDLYGPVSVDNLLYYDGLAGAQFGKLPKECKNKSRWVINFDFDGQRWDLVNTAYIRKSKVYIGVSIPPNGLCDIWAISTAPLSFTTTSSATTDIETRVLNVP